MRRSAATLVAVVLAAGLSALPAAAATAPTSAPDDQSPPPASSFQKVTLNDRPGEPMSLAVLPDLRVLHTARTGQVRIQNPRAPAK
jgi:glucose/arabinose dehydrogenase